MKEIQMNDLNECLIEEKKQQKKIEIKSKTSFPESLFEKKMPTPQQRIVYFDGKTSPQSVLYQSNKLQNHKYTYISFLPVVLFHQFQYFFNLFFLFIALSQLIPILKVGFLFSYLAPLTFVLAVTIGKQAYDDYKRRVRDKQTNQQIYTILKSSSKQQTKAMELKVGDLVDVKCNQRVPADIVLLHSDDKQGTTFIRTDQLDGETDWKLKKSVSYTQKIALQTNLRLLNASVMAQAPRDDIYKFKGVMKLQDERGEGYREGLSIQNIIWGNTYVASGNILGIVVYSGREMRSMLNSRDKRNKSGRIDNQLNYLSKVLFLLMCILALIIVLSSGLGTYWIIDIFRHILLLSSIIPISLRVNLDFSKLIFSYKINKDQDIKNTIARNSQIPEEMGRVQYILSDKTGTLTQNQMIFKKISINQVGTFIASQKLLLKKIIQKNCQKTDGPLKDIHEKYKQSDTNKIRWTKRQKQYVVRDMITAIALCHNVTPIYQNGIKSYQASSPDQIALVQIAQSLNMTLIQRDQTTITLQNPIANRQKYKILANFPFTSETKRMGILVKNQLTKRNVFYLKGADVIMKQKVPELQRGFVMDQCQDLARQGLRTLVITQKYMSDKAVKQFLNLLQQANTSIYNRQQLKTKALQQIQNNMELLGITGVEDKLQQNVSQTVQSLKFAGISIWMITGDKVETACCIAINAGFKGNSQMYIIQGCTEGLSLRSKLDQFLLKLDTILVIDGTSIAVALQSLEQLFYQAACTAPAVICCRVSPTQKALLTQGIKKFTKKIVLGIGDGGNDVGMILSADVGIGIVGKEGKQAALASDYSIEKFRYLEKLLLWHGRLAYKNTALMSQFVIHRGLIISVIQTIFSLVFYSVAIPIYNGWLMLGYSTVYTMFPVQRLLIRCF